MVDKQPSSKRTFTDFSIEKILAFESNPDTKPNTKPKSKIAKLDTSTSKISDILASFKQQLQKPSDHEVSASNQTDFNILQNMPKSILTSDKTDTFFFNLECNLINSDLWNRFSELGTEMIITKAGRRMFPPLKIKFELKNNANSIMESNLPISNDEYCILVDIIPINDKRYRYAYHKSAWLIAGRSDENRIYSSTFHSDGRISESSFLNYLKDDEQQTNSSLCKGLTVSFDRIKLTNSGHHNKNGFILLNSMHRYVPRIHVVRVGGSEKEKEINPVFRRALDQVLSTKSSVEDLVDTVKRMNINFNPSTQDKTIMSLKNILSAELMKHLKYKTFTFPETQFTAVTAYQNQLITRLKIESNPFAKGFRDTVVLSHQEENLQQGQSQSGNNENVQDQQDKNENNQNKMTEEILALLNKIR